MNQGSLSGLRTVTPSRLNCFASRISYKTLRICLCLLGEVLKTSTNKLKHIEYHKEFMKTYKNNGNIKDIVVTFMDTVAVLPFVLLQMNLMKMASLSIFQV